MRTKHGLFYGWVVLAIAFITISVSFAIRNTFSVFYPAIVEEFGWGRGNTALMFSINILVYGLVAPVVGSLIDRFDPRVVLPVGACIMGGGIALCSLASTQWQFYLLYGVMVAIGLSITGWAPLTTIASNWFAKKRGLVFGVLGASFGTSLMAASIAQFLISSFGWKLAYVIIGTFSIAVIVPSCAIFMRHAPRDKEPLSDGTAPMPSDPQMQHRVKAESNLKGGWSNATWTIARAMKTYQFWLLFLIAFCLMGVAETTVVAHQVYFFRDVGYLPMQAATIYSAFGIAFVLGNLCGSFSDRLGREIVFIPSCLLAAGGTSILFLVNGTSLPWLPFLFSVCFGFGVGNAVTAFYATVADLFHGKHFGSIQGFMVLGFSLGGTISPWLAGFLHDRTGTYVVAFCIVLGSLLTCVVLMGIIAPRRLISANPQT